MPLYRAELIRRKKPLIGPQIHDVSRVLYLPFDLDDGSYARDRSGYSNHGTIHGAKRVAGKIGGALDFDGVDDYVDLGTASILYPDIYTLVAWIKPAAIPIENFAIFGMQRTFFLASDRLIHHPNHAQAAISSSPFSYSANQWLHVAVTYSFTTGDYAFYVDGVETGKGTLTRTKPKVYRTYIGTYDALKWFFDGVIDEVCIYNRVLSQSEIKRLKNLRGV